MGLLQLGGRDPDLSVSGYVLSSLVQHLASVLIRLQLGQGQPQLGGGRRGEGRGGEERGGEERRGEGRRGEGRGGKGRRGEGRGGKGRGGRGHAIGVAAYNSSLARECYQVDSTTCDGRASTV